MSDETLLTAARRVVRFFNIDMNKGGLITDETQHAIETLDQQVRLEDANKKAGCPVSKDAGILTFRLLNGSRINCRDISGPYIDEIITAIQAWGRNLK